MEPAEDLSSDKGRISDSDRLDTTTADTDTSSSSDECSLSYFDFIVHSDSSDDTTIKLNKFPIEHYKKGKQKLGRGAFGTVRV